MKQQSLIVTSGLPGSGKSTIADGIARKLGAPVVSVDPIEAAMWASGLPRGSTGIAAYKVAETIASENLKQGHTVIVDAVNPVEEARSMWRELGARFSIKVSFIECCCSEQSIHRKRIQKRIRNIEGMSEISWESVQFRRTEFEAWSGPRLTLDTAFDKPDVSIATALAYLLRV